MSLFHLETMLPFPYVRSQLFHESVSSFWPLPKLPCEGVRTAICGPPSESGAEVALTICQCSHLPNLDISTTSPLVSSEIPFAFFHFSLWNLLSFCYYSFGLSPEIFVS